MPSICNIPNYYHQNCVLVFGAIFAASHCQSISICSCFFLASVCKLSKAHGSDMRAGDSKSPGGRIESGAAKVLMIKSFFTFSFLT